MATIKELKASGAPRFKVPGKEAIYDAFDQFLAENFLGETVEAIAPAPAGENAEFAPQVVKLYELANTTKGNAGLWKAGTGTSSKKWDMSFLQGILNQFSTLPAATRGKTVSDIKLQLEDFRLSNRWDSGLLKLKVFRKDGYIAIHTDEQLCWIYDKLANMHKIEDEEFDVFMKNYFTAPKKTAPKKK